MKEKYWELYVSLKHKERYYWHYRIRSVRINTAINVICALASAYSIAGWSIWGNFPFIWAGIIAISQIVQVLKPMFPFSKQLISLNFLLPDFEKLLIEVDHEWDIISGVNIDDPEEYCEVSNRIKFRNEEFISIQSKFIGNTYFPIIPRISKKAEIDCKNYFYHLYNVREEV